MPSSRGSSQPRDQTQVFHIAGGFFYCLSHQENPRILEWVAYPFSKDLPDPGIKPGSPALQEDSLPAKLPGSPELLRYRSLVLITGQGAANDFILLFSMDTISEQNYSIHNGAIQWPPHCILISLALSPSSLYFKVFLQPSALLKPPC